MTARTTRTSFILSLVLLAAGSSGCRLRSGYVPDGGSITDLLFSFDVVPAAPTLVYVDGGMVTQAYEEYSYSSTEEYYVDDGGYPPDPGYYGDDWKVRRTGRGRRGSR